MNLIKSILGLCKINIYLIILLNKYFTINKLYFLSHLLFLYFYFIMYCKYKDIFGKPNEGIHSFRIFNISVIDTLLTIFLA